MLSETAASPFERPCSCRSVSACVLVATDNAAAPDRVVPRKDRRLKLELIGLYQDRDLMCRKPPGGAIRSRQCDHELGRKLRRGGPTPFSEFEPFDSPEAPSASSILHFIENSEARSLGAGMVQAALILAAARERPLKPPAAVPRSKSPVLGTGFSMAGSTSLGWMTPFDWSSFLLRFWPGAVGWRHRA